MNTQFSTSPPNVEKNRTDVEKLWGKYEVFDRRQHQKRNKQETENICGGLKGRASFHFPLKLRI